MLASREFTALTDAWSNLELSDALDEGLGELIVDPTLYQYAIRGDADLSRAAELDCHGGVDGCLQRCVVEDDAAIRGTTSAQPRPDRTRTREQIEPAGLQGSIAAQLEGALLECRSRLLCKLATDAGGASEGDLADLQQAQFVEDSQNVSIIV